MSVNKVEMSLDDIIKANKASNKNNNKSVRKGAAGRRIPKRKTDNFGAKNKVNRGAGVQKRGKKRVVASRLNKNNNNNKRFVKKNIPNNNRNRQNYQRPNASTIATKKLVQNLVKKALARQNAKKQVVGRVAATPNIVGARRHGGVRLMKKTVVMNRVSPKSRVIGQQRRRVAPMPVKTIIKRTPIRYNARPPTVQIMESASSVRRNFVPRRAFTPRQQQRFIQPRVAARPGFQLVEVPINTGGSVRQHISAMRRQVVYSSPPQLRQPRFRSRQHQQQPQFVQRQQFQQRRRFPNNRKPQQQQRNLSSFYEPNNFLQRVPVAKTTIVRRF